MDNGATGREGRESGATMEQSSVSQVAGTTAPRHENQDKTRRRFWRRHWFQIFVSGLVLLFLVERTLVATANPNFVPSAILLGAFLVPVTFTTCTSDFRTGTCPCHHWRSASSGAEYWGRSSLEPSSST
jgi:hypothetical protein